MDFMDLLDPFGLFGGTRSQKYAEEAYRRAQESLTKAREEANKYLEEGRSKAQAYLDAVDTSRKSAKELYAEGKEIAGAAAVNKAGIAKKQAKAASSMAGASKLFGAIQGAQAATEAATEGYDQTAQNAASMAAGQENAQKAAEMSKAQSQANVESNLASQQAGQTMQVGQSEAQAAQNYGQQQITAEENRKNRMGSLASAFLGSL